FEGTDQIDWDSAPQIEWEKLSEKEKLLTEALVKRGASFMQALGGVLEGESPYDTLLSLMEKGIVCADSFVPVRQWLDREKIRKSTARVRAGARVKALSAGRWDLVRPIRLLTLQEQMDRCFDRYKVLCRETAAACGFSWQEALKSLRILEYTGQVRRGYFVEGLSGAQFIRGTDFGGITAALRNAGEEIVWMNGADPMQVWGKLLPSQMDRAFLNVQGSAVALRGGMPVAVFERNGGILRVFEEEFLEEVLERFVEGYRRGQIFTGKKRILVKEYPDISVKSMEKSGFAREVQGYGLYR
ncbi:MAG: DEAD/DEAH box helicase, partial [Lachnospiraceae bacterium]|nr:DEAD/DEAH box helicase [Lachnospiraceae bacterium]